MKINQFGRSMVETLGVLAIIGVLSVGAIAGYSKAMNRYKINKQVTQINQIISYIGYYYPFGTKPRGSIIPMLKKLEVIPKEMIKENDDNYIYDVFNNKIEILDGIYDKDNWGEGKSITGLVFYSDILNDNTSKEVCINLLNLFKEYHDSVWYVELTSSKNGDTTDIFASFYGDKYCTEDNCISHVNVSKAFDFCSKAVESVNGGENFGYNIWWWDN